MISPNWDQETPPVETNGVEHRRWLPIPIILTVLSEHIAIQLTSFRVIPPVFPSSTSKELVLYLCTDTLYTVCALHCLYLSHLL